MSPSKDQVFDVLSQSYTQYYTQTTSVKLPVGRED